jgi:hypothetical protein
VAQEPPRSVRQFVVSLNLSMHHSQTLPPTLQRPRAFGLKAAIGAVRGNASWKPVMTAHHSGAPALDSLPA